MTLHVWSVRWSSVKTKRNMSSTPSRNKGQPDVNKSLADNFSPIVVPISPASKTPQRGNLTGNPRKVSDSAADVFNRIQEWNGEHLCGVKILNNIVTLKMTSLKDTAENMYPDGLQEQCCLLEEVCRKMNNIVSALEIIAKEMIALLKLEKFQQTDQTPMFLTWPAHKYGSVCNDVFLAYKQELQVKYCAKENIAHCRTKEMLMLHLAAWVYQPYITSDVELSVESLLYETGHRTLS